MFTAKFKETLHMIQFEHTIFALPFALISMLDAAEGLPSAKIFFLILLSMLFARSSAMAFNRYIDADIDLKNPRTNLRSIPAKRLSKIYVLNFTIISSAFFIITTYFINKLAFILSPIALLIIFTYSLTKRFTIFTHFILGLSLAIAPVGAWIAVRESISLPPILLGGFVLFWVAGFDIIYSCQDYKFDVANRLYSFPQKYGIKNALLLTKIIHFIAFIFLTLFYFFGHFGIVFLIGVMFTAICLLYQNLIVKPNDLSKINTAFFTTNGISSILLLIFICIDLFI